MEHFHSFMHIIALIVIFSVVRASQVPDDNEFVSIDNLPLQNVRYDNQHLSFAESTLPVELMRQILQNVALSDFLTVLRVNRFAYHLVRERLVHTLIHAANNCDTQMIPTVLEIFRDRRALMALMLDLFRGTGITRSPDNQSHSLTKQEMELWEESVGAEDSLRNRLFHALVKSPRIKFTYEELNAVIGTLDAEEHRRFLEDCQSFRHVRGRFFCIRTMPLCIASMVLLVSVIMVIVYYTTKCWLLCRHSGYEDGFRMYEFRNASPGENERYWCHPACNMWSPEYERCRQPSDFYFCHFN